MPSFFILKGVYQDVIKGLYDRKHRVSVKF